MNLLHVYKINNMEGLINKKNPTKIVKKCLCVILTFISWLICIYKCPLYFSVLGYSYMFDYLSIDLFNTFFLHYLFSNYCKVKTKTGERWWRGGKQTQKQKYEQKAMGLNRGVASPQKSPLFCEPHGCQATQIMNRQGTILRTIPSFMDELQHRSQTHANTGARILAKLW